MEVGHWVKRKRWGHVGWVTSIKKNISVDVQYQGYTSTVHPNLLESYEAILPEVQEEAKRIFVEMALMTNDKDWFMEVTAK